uniref:CCHC-type domain-containing protein n=1 Tax=Maylandia zebra TaxID=106582 RepID=A0A3P9DUH2_9CICH
WAAQACRKCGSTGHNADSQIKCGYVYRGRILPSTRGILHRTCRKCGSTGHNADRCEQMRCRSCGKIGHITKDCKEPRKCHLCDSETHMARDCTRPRSYSERAGNEHYRKSGCRS